jgi:hypothetical protein
LTKDIPKTLIDILKSCLDVDKSNRIDIQSIINCIHGIKNNDKAIQENLQIERISLDPAKKPFCIYGGKCNFLEDIIHLSKYDHPDECIHGGNCKNLFNENHLFQYVHPPKCFFGGKCIDSSKTHIFKYLHPPECLYEGICTYFESSHDILFRHPLDCKFGEKCNINHYNHLFTYSHPKNNCVDGFHCLDISIEHQKFYSHPYLPICENGLLCGNLDKFHREQFTHACKHGFKCIRIDMHSHLKNHLHLKQICKFGKQCISIKDRNHLSNYLHPLDKTPYKITCKHGSFCMDGDYEHLMNFSHPNFSFGLCEVFNWNKGIDFRKNKEYLDQFMVGEKVDKILLSKVSSYIKKLFHPVHRCSILDLKMMLKNGFLSNNHMMKYFKSDPENIALKMVNHSSIILDIKNENKYPPEDELFEKLSKKIITRKHIELKNGNQMSLISNISNEIGMILKDLSCIFKKKDLDSCLEIINHIADLTFPRELNIESDEVQIKSIIGHHTGYEDGDIIIIFSQCLMYHPDFSMTPHPKKLFLNESTFERRFWASDKNMNNSMKYQSSKLNASIPGWEETLAKEMILRHWKNISSIQDLEESIEVNHFEGLLPSLISFDFIEKIILPSNDFNQLSNAEKSLLIKHFSHKQNGQGIVKYDQKSKTPILQFKKNYLYETVQKLSGFSVSIQKNRELVIIPHSIINQQFNISMDVKGDEFILFLMSGIEEKDICYSIIVEGGKSTINKYDKLQNSIIIGEVEDDKQGDSQNFNGISLSYKNGSIIFKLKSGMYLRAKDQFPPTIKYFAISCFEKLICFENIEIK